VGSRDINASVACANIGAFVAAAFIPSEPNAAVGSVGSLPQILRHGWIIFGEFVVSLTLTDFRGIRLSN
jgi:hypothetical protein